MKRWKPVSLVAAAAVLFATAGAQRAATTPAPAAKRTMTVTIHGNNPVPPGEPCVWEAIISGGTPPYTVNWTGGSYSTGSGAWYTTSFGWNGGLLTVSVQDANWATAQAQTMIYTDHRMIGCGEW